MAQRVEVVLIDDIDGGHADETVSFALDGVTYEIDRQRQECKKLRDDIRHVDRTRSSQWQCGARRRSRRPRRRPRTKRTDLGDGAGVGPGQRPQGLRPRSDLGRDPGAPTTRRTDSRTNSLIERATAPERVAVAPRAPVSDWRRPRSRRRGLPSRRPARGPRQPQLASSPRLPRRPRSRPTSAARPRSARSRPRRE